MYALGIDCGNETTRALLLKDNIIVAYSKIPTDFDISLAAKTACDLVCSQEQITMDQIDRSAVTGGGKQLVDFISLKLNDISAASYGVRNIYPEETLIIDMGAESSKAIRLGSGCTIADYSTNDKCASGSGTFIETMARALQVSIEEIGELSLKHTKDISLVAQCVVFAESEVISLIHEQETIENIAYGILSGIANRVAGLVRKVGNGIDSAVLIGGPGLNIGLVHCLEHETDKKIIVPEQVEYVSALGAAIYASEYRNEKKEG